MILAPREDGRTSTSILAELTSDAPGYISGWRPDTASSAASLLHILARFAGLVVQGMDQAPDKGFLAYLDALGLDLLPPTPARAPLVFSVSPASPSDPILVQGGQVAAPPTASFNTGAASTPPEPTLFATERTITLARARVSALFSLLPARDVWADHSRSMASGLTLFTDYAPVEHCLYLAHDTLFGLAPTAEVVIDVSMPEKRSRRRHGVKLRWQYLSADGWVDFADVVDMTNGLSREGQLKLTKTGGAAPKQGLVNGVSSYWLRAVIDESVPLPGGATRRRLPQLETMVARVSFGKDDIPLDVAFADGLRLDSSQPFRPFGARPAVGATFLLACDEAFKREHARIGVHFDVDMTLPATPSKTLSLLWEYSTGPGTWRPLGGGDNELLDHTANLTIAREQPAVQFVRPDDWKQVRANGQSHYWLRVRVATGDYGGPPKYVVDASTGTVKVEGEAHAPLLTALSVSYRYQTEKAIPDHCFAQNHFVFVDHTDDCRWLRETFQPFLPLPDVDPAVYVGFDAPLPDGAFSMFWNIGDSAGAGLQPPPSHYAWEYLTSNGWRLLPVEDETSGFRVPGMVQMLGQPDQAASPGPSGPTYWVRARQRIAAPPTAVPVDSVWTNAVWGTQSSLHQRELTSRSEGAPMQIAKLLHPPVLEGQLVEVQEWRGDGREWTSIFAAVDPALIRQDTDSSGRVTAIWVSWQQKPHLFSSTSVDRHYTIDHVNALIRFGDGRRGMVPPPGAAIAVTYSSGSAAPANVPAGAIAQLHSPIPYVTGVTNPVAAAGGAAAEPVDRVHSRGPAHLRAGRRALTAADYECMAAEASAEVALARCLPLTGPAGTAQPGWVTVAIVPWSTDAMPEPSTELLRRVRRHLAQLTPAAIAPNIRVTGVSYMQVSVEAALVAVDAGATSQLEAAVHAALAKYLHPLTGGIDGQGWRFGEAVHRSQVARVIRSTPGLGELRRVRLTVDGFEQGDAVIPGPLQLPSSAHHVLRWEVAS